MKIFTLCALLATGATGCPEVPQHVQDFATQAQKQTPVSVPEPSTFALLGAALLLLLLFALVRGYGYSRTNGA